MECFYRGKVLRLLFPFFFLVFSSKFVCLSSDSINVDEVKEHENKPNSNSILDLQETQLKKLENLVKNLSESVAKLESQICDCRTRESEERGSLNLEGSRSLKGKNDVGVILSNGVKEIDDKNKPVEREKDWGITVAKYKPSWLEKFQFLSAVQVEFEITCLHVLPFVDYEGLSKYIAIGDGKGRIFIFQSNGDIHIQFDTLSDSPVISMLSYISIQKNETILVTGHRDGAILMHKVWEAANGDEWQSLSIKNAHQLFFPEKMNEGSPVTILELHQLGRIRYILASDVSGRLRVFRENGDSYGIAVASSRPLAFLKQRLLFLTEKGAGSLDLRSMTLRETECEGLNGSLASNYVFDASERSKAYGCTMEGDLVHVLLLGDTINFKCRVRMKRKSEMNGPFAVQAIKGYLLLVNPEKIFVYNVSSQHYIRVVGLRRPLFFSSLDDIKSSFLNSRIPNGVSEIQTPLIATDREKLVVLGLGNGHVGIYRSTLPVYKKEFNTVLWSSPVFLFFTFLLIAWKCFGKKRELFTSWGSDDPFNETSTAPGSMYRDLGGKTTHRGSPRRYVSPSRYSAEGVMPFRTSSSADPNFRATSELKFRGQNLETTGLPKRRESFFPSSQAAEDRTD